MSGANAGVIVGVKAVEVAVTLTIGWPVVTIRSALGAVAAPATPGPETTAAPMIPMVPSVIIAVTPQITWRWRALHRTDPVELLDRAMRIDLPLDFRNFR